MTLVETAIAYNNKAETWQGTADTESPYVLAGSLPLACVAFRDAGLLARRRES